MNSILKLFICLFFMIIAPLAHAENEEIKNFFLQYQNALNSRNPETIRNFLNFYVIDEAVFVIETAQVDPINVNNIVSRQSLKLNKVEYINYIIALVKSPDEYHYRADLGEVQINSKDGSILAALSEKEATIISGFDTDKKDRYRDYILTASNCNVALEDRNGKYYFRAANCLEKVNQEREYDKLGIIKPAAPVVTSAPKESEPQKQSDVDNQQKDIKKQVLDELPKVEEPKTTKKPQVEEKAPTDLKQDAKNPEVKSKKEETAN